MLSLLLSTIGIANTARAAAITINDHQRGMSFTLPRSDWPVLITRETIKILTDHEADAYLKISNVLANANASPEDSLKRKTAAARTADADLVFHRELETISFAGGVTAASVMIESPLEGAVYRFVYLIHQGSLYELLFFSKSSYFDSTKHDFAGILKSLAFFKPDKDVVTITHGGLGMTVDAPARSNWSVQIANKSPTGSNQESIKIATLQDRALVYFSGGSAPYPNATLAEAYSQHVTTTRAASPEITVFTENRPATVGGVPALEFSFKNAQQRANRHFVLIHHGQVREVQFEAADALFEEFKPDFADILKGISFQVP